MSLFCPCWNKWLCAGRCAPIKCVLSDFPCKLSWREGLSWVGAGSDLQTVSMKCKSNVTALRKALDAERWYLKLQPKANWFCLWTFFHMWIAAFFPPIPSDHKRLWNVIFSIIIQGVKMVRGDKWFWQLHCWVVNWGSSEKPRVSEAEWPLLLETRILSDISNDKYPYSPLKGLIEREPDSIFSTFVNSINNNPCPFLHFGSVLLTIATPPQHLFGQEELSCTFLAGKADVLNKAWWGWEGKAVLLRKSVFLVVWTTDCQNTDT